MSFNRDSLVALCLTLASGGLMLASFEIREPDYGVLSPAESATKLTAEKVGLLMGGSDALNDVAQDAAQDTAPGVSE